MRKRTDLAVKAKIIQDPNLGLILNQDPILGPIQNPNLDQKIQMIKVDLKSGNFFI